MNYKSLTKKELIQILEFRDKPICVPNPKKVFDYLRPYGKEKQEHFIVVMLDGAMQIINIKVVSIGVANKCLVHAREVFAPAIENRACYIVIAHNHPSGCIEPSDEDIAVKNKMVQAGKILGIQVLDSIVFSDKDYYSMLGTKI